MKACSMIVNEICASYRQTESITVIAISTLKAVLRDVLFCDSSAPAVQRITQLVCAQNVSQRSAGAVRSFDYRSKQSTTSSRPAPTPTHLMHVQ
jgi:hypothetical protein